MTAPNETPATGNSYQPGQEIVPGYTLVRPLGGGMAGDVWVARAAGGTDVALKIVRSLSLMGGRKEFSALRTIRNVRHPNLCPVHGFWTKAPDGRVLEDRETATINPDDSSSGLWSSDPTTTPTQPSDATDSSAVQGTMAVDQFGSLAGRDPLATSERNNTSGGINGGTNGGDVGPDHGAPKQPTASKAEQLIVVMGLGDCTLYDRLQEVRVAAGLPKHSNEICHGLEPAEAVKYLRSAASAIDLLNQEHSIYHCDIKPQNILLVGGEAQVCDFGLAHKMVGDIRQTQQAFASPAYAAPEVLEAGTYSRTVDQYSLAITYFELRTGLLPFDVTTGAKILLAKCTGKLNLEPLSPPERKVIRRAMHVTPSERYPSCADFVKALSIAAGIEKSGGITPMRLAIASTLMVALSAVSVLGWRSLHRSSFDSVFSSGITADELADDALAKLNEFKSLPSPDYLLGFAPLRDSIDTAHQSFPMAGSETKERLQTIALDATTLLSAAMAERLNHGKVADASGFIRQDIERIAGLTMDDMPMFDPESLDGRRIRLQESLFQLQLNQAGGETEMEDLANATTELREFLLDDPEAFESSSQRILASITLALTHRPSGDAHGVYIESASFDDIALAQSLINQFGQPSVPEFFKRKWVQMRDSPGGILAQLEQAVALPQKDARRMNRIEQTWPLLSITANLNDLNNMLRVGRWDLYSSALDEARQKADAMDHGVLDDEISTKLAVLHAMSSALRAPSRTDELLEVIDATLGADSGVSDEFFRQSLPEWLGEVADRYLMRTAPLDAFKCRRIRELGMRLCERFGGTTDVPTSVDALGAAASLQANATDETLRAVNKKSAVSSGDRVRHRWLLAAAWLQSATMNDQTLTRRELAAIQDSLDLVATASDLPPSITSAHVNFVRGLLAWEANDRSAAANAWDALVEISSSCDDLGIRRAQWVSMRQFDMVVDRSGVADDEMLTLRFVDPGISAPDQPDPVAAAVKWIAPRDLSPAWTRRKDELALQQAIAKQITLDRPLSELTVANSLIRAVGDSLDDRVPDRDLGQLYRSVFEVSRAKLASGDNDDADLDRLHLMLTCAVAMADMGLGDQIRDRRWFQDILQPAMKALDATLTISSREDFVWEFPETLDSDVVRRLCGHYLKSDRNLMGIDWLGTVDPGSEPQDRELRWIQTLEKASAILASDETTTALERGNRWLAAAEYRKRHQDASNEIWTRPSLQKLNRYLNLAEQQIPGDPNVALSRALMHYYEANLLQDYQAKVDALGAAAREVSAAIEVLEQVGPTVGLYNAYCRHANTMVSLAFAQAGDGKAANLRKGRQHANAAVAMLSDPAIKAEVLENTAYHALGNCCEDLAFYCSTKGSRTQRDFFEEAIEAFRVAASLTEFGKSMQARYSLARCEFRYWETCGDDPMLRRANESLGEFSDDASPQAQREWLSWKSKIMDALGDRAAATTAAKQAYDLLQASRSSDQQRSEVLYQYASCLTGQSGEDNQRALAILRTELKAPSITAFWKSLELQLELLKELERYEEILPLAEKLSAERIAEVLLDPREVTRRLVTLTSYVRVAGFPATVDGIGFVDRDRAARAIDRIDQQLAPMSDKIASDPSAQRYRQFISANAFSLSQGSLSDRVKRFLDVLSDGDEPVPDLDPDVVMQIRLAMLDQFVQVLRHFSTSAKSKQMFAEAIPRLKSESGQVLRQQLLLIQRESGHLSPTQNSAVQALGKIFARD